MEAMIVHWFRHLKKGQQEMRREDLKAELLKTIPTGGKF